MARSVLYLHGFASSPASSKAQRFKRELEARGVAFVCPDLNQPEFETLTASRMLAQVDRVLDALPVGPTAIVGSSLGGFVALHAAARDWRRERAGVAPRVDRLILLAPAVEFGGGRLRTFGDHDVAEWRRAGSVEMFHHGEGRPRRIGFSLYEDAAAYDAFALHLDLPILVFQGRRDDTVSPAAVAAWAAGRPNVDLRLLDDDHQLTASLDLIWRDSALFLGV